MTEFKTRRPAAALFYTMWAVILAVSVHDGFLVLLNRWTIADDEQNPVGRWLIAADGGDVRLFLAAKLVGTIAAASVLLVLYWKQPPLAWVVCVVLALGQLGLFVYLTCW